MNFDTIKEKLVAFEQRVKDFMEGVNHQDADVAAKTSAGAPGFFGEVSKLAHELHSEFAGFCETIEARVRDLEAGESKVVAELRAKLEEVAGGLSTLTDAHAQTAEDASRALDEAAAANTAATTSAALQQVAAASGKVVDLGPAVGTVAHREMVAASSPAAEGKPE